MIEGLRDLSKHRFAKCGVPFIGSRGCGARHGTWGLEDAPTISTSKSSRKTNCMWYYVRGTQGVMVVLVLLIAPRALGSAPIAKLSGRERGIQVSAMLEGEENFDLLSAGREHAAAPKTHFPAASTCLTLLLATSSVSAPAHIVVTFETCILTMRMVHVAGPCEKRTSIHQH